MLYCFIDFIKNLIKIVTISYNCQNNLGFIQIDLLNMEINEFRKESLELKNKVIEEYYFLVQ